MSLRANRPDPDDPGGLGAEESGTERTGPTHTNFMLDGRGGRWAEVGRHYDSANDPVTGILPGCSPIHERRCEKAPLRRRRVEVIMSRR
ncbi:hypothetical protein BRAS3843_550006 [Bradyrhizobium sp. STM 3843]|nr:hypothetical protein BRAS3843_550006 [Bradyrhizobium sp. STM 3843]